MQVCADRLEDHPHYNQWKVCMLEFGHTVPHKSSDGFRWPRKPEFKIAVSEEQKVQGSIW